jgi:hypothetical protein
MTTTKKLVVAVVALSLALVTVIGGTLAWLVSTTEEVKNTFTVGSIVITLDEAKVDEYGVAIDGANRVTKNEYKLVPGGSYTKDPTVHVAANNEKCYVFVKVENDIVNFEADGNTAIAEQIKANGWTALEGNTGVFYKVVEANVVATDLIVFGTFKVADDVDKVALQNVNSDTVVTVKAYAIQYLGFENKPVDAWLTVSK